MLPFLVMHFILNEMSLLRQNNSGYLEQEYQLTDTSFKHNNSLVYEQYTQRLIGSRHFLWD
jgi:hypothetical protein